MEESCNHWTTREFPLQYILEEAKLGFEIHVFVIPWRKPLLDLVSPPIPPPADSSPPFGCALRQVLSRDTVETRMSSAAS